MRLSEICVRRPVGTSLLTLGWVLLGCLAYRALPVSTLPEVDTPTLVVSTRLPGASAETMAALVTTPLERQLGLVPALTSMSSVTGFGASEITLQFDLARDIDGAELDVQAAIAQAAALLPPSLPAPPAYTKVNPADAPILTLAVVGGAGPRAQVAALVDGLVVPRIAQVLGVGRVETGGMARPALRVEADPLALTARGLGLATLRRALVEISANLPKGSLDGPEQAWAIVADDQLAAPAAFARAPIAWAGEAPVRLGDVARVRLGAEDEHVAAWADGRPAILLDVERQPGANVVRVAERVRALLPALARALPADVEVRVLGDRTDGVRASLAEMGWTLVFTVALVVGVMWMFLRDWRATLVPAVTVPLSLLGCLVAMVPLGFGLDNLSLMALTVSCGFVVDDAIVMVENVARHIEAGVAPLEAAITGARQIAFTIVSLTASLVAVLIPLFGMGGVIGRLFRAFSVTLALAVVLSAWVSLTVTPMLAGRLLRPAIKSPGHAPPRGLLLAAYARALRAVIAWPRTTLAAALGTLAATAWAAVAIPKGFFPRPDAGQITGVVEAPADVAFARMAEVTEAVAACLGRDPAVLHVAAQVGIRGELPSLNLAHLALTLVPPGARRGTLDATLARLEGTCAQGAEATLSLRPASELALGSEVGRAPFRLSLESAVGGRLADDGRRLIAALGARPELRHVASDQAMEAPTLRLAIDRDAAAKLGVSVAALDDALYDALGQRMVGTLFTQERQLRVVLEVDRAARDMEHLLTHVFAESDRGEWVALANLVRAERGSHPVSVAHRRQYPAFNIDFDLAEGVAVDAGVAAARAALAEVGLPAATRAHLLGDADAFEGALGDAGWLVVASVIAVYLVLGMLYESFAHPLTILSTLPSAGLGALCALWAANMPFDIVALIGVVLLIGIVKKNAIMMIDFALQAERQGAPPQEAIVEACLVRFRPIMMTTLAALLGGVPLALSFGVGGELRRPLGVSICGGLVVSQALTLFTTPVVYLAVDRARRALGRPKDAAAAAPGGG